MPGTRRCEACQRPNGPHFARCMACGEWLGVLPPAQGGPRDSKDAAQRALRLLQGLTPARRALLPPQFLHSVQIQANGEVESPLEDADTDPLLRAVRPPRPPSGSISIDLDLDLDDAPPAPDPTGGRPGSGLGASNPARVEPRAPAEDARPRPPTRPSPPPPSARPSGNWAPSAYRPRMTTTPSASPPPPPPPEVASDEGPAAEEPAEDRTSAPGLHVLDIASASELHGHPEGAGPLVEALGSGRGPFGPREARFRLVLLPDPTYKDALDHLKHRLKAELGVDLYTGQLFLHRTTPTHLAADEDGAVIRRKAEALRSSGLRLLVVERDRWLERALPRPVVRARGERPAAAVFVDPDGQELAVTRQRLDALVVAELPGVDGGRPTTLVDVLLLDDPSPLRLRLEAADLPEAISGGAWERVRRLAAWLSPDAARPLPIDDGFRRVPDSARSTRSGSSKVAPVEGDFTEYTLLVDLGRRLFGP